MITVGRRGLHLLCREDGHPQWPAPLLVPSWPPDIDDEARSREVARDALFDAQLMRVDRAGRRIRNQDLDLAVDLLGGWTRTVDLVHQAAEDSIVALVLSNGYQAVRLVGDDYGGDGEFTVTEVDPTDPMSALLALVPTLPAGQLSARVPVRPGMLDAHQPSSRRSASEMQTVRLVTSGAVALGRIGSSTRETPDDPVQRNPQLVGYIDSTAARAHGRYALRHEHGQAVLSPARANDLLTAARMLLRSAVV